MKKMLNANYMHSVTSFHFLPFFISESFKRFCSWFDHQPYGFMKGASLYVYHRELEGRKEPVGVWRQSVTVRELRKLAGNQLCRAHGLRLPEELCFGSMVIITQLQVHLSCNIQCPHQIQHIHYSDSFFMFKPFWELLHCLTAAILLRPTIK